MTFTVYYNCNDVSCIGLDDIPAHVNHVKNVAHETIAMVVRSLDIHICNSQYQLVNYLINLKTLIDI